MSLPTALYRAEQVRELERLVCTELQIESYTLMQRAGHAAWETLVDHWPQALEIVVVCGGGNNGGDGYVLAARALTSGRRVSVVSVVNPLRLSGDARRAYQEYISQAGARCEVFTPDRLVTADVIVDALLGTGLDRAVTGDFRDAIAAVNHAGKPVLALDIPSGLHADTGAIMGTAVQADVTISFVGLKQGLLTGAGRACCGEIRYADLAGSPSCRERLQPASVRMDISTLSGLLPARARDAHKGHYGHVLVIGGDYGYAGAARMAAEAAARTGAGLVSLGTRPEHAIVMPLTVPEIMAHAIEQPTDLQPLLEKATVVAIGPGLGQSDWGSRLLARVLETRLPLVLDADALNLLAREPLARDNWVLTPHPGEIARLLRTTTAAIAADRYACARDLQQQFGGVCVLKGSGTLVADGTNIHLCSAGNPGMASGGMGDVLTGIIAGLSAQQLRLADAARLGVCLHAAAADAAGGDGERGLLAMDLMPWVRKLLN